MDIVRKINYRRPMGTEDIEKMSMEAGVINEEIRDREESLKAYTTSVKEQIKCLSKELDELLDCLRLKRFPEALLLVREQYDKPIAGKKTVTVSETGELLEICDMTDEEKESLFRDRSGSEDEPADNVIDAEAVAGK